MNKEQESMEVYLGILSKTPRNEEGRKKIREILTQKFMEKMPASVERNWDLPSIHIKNPSKRYGDLLIEARDLYINGYFYSCVAMCGIVGERLIKDVLREHVLIKKDEKLISPDKNAFDQLERLEVYGIVNFLNATGLLNKDATEAAQALGKLRNNYAHSRGKNPQEDAIKAIKYLHRIVNDTVSIFKDFDLTHGVMMFKDMEIVAGGMKAKKIELHKASAEHQ
jgi:hypothetical protein